jgi:hypothetical protein
MTTLDLRHLALILRAGKRAADGMQDAALCVALDAMTEMATWYAEHPDGGTLFPVDEDFARLAEHYR